MELVNRHQRVIKCPDICEFVEGKAESRMGADQNLVVAAHKADKGIHFALVFIVAAARAEIVSGLTRQSAKKPCFANSVSANEPPMDISGTAIIAF